MILNISATNKNGDSFTFDRNNRVVNGLDLSGLEADVNYLETNLSGSRYQNTKLRNRNFDIEVRLLRGYSNEIQMDDRRQIMYKVFNPESNPIRFDFETSDGTGYYLIAYATATPRMAPDKGNDNVVYQRALLQFTCTDPYLYEDVNTRVDISTWIPNFEFDLEIPLEGIELEYKAQNANAVVEYDGDSEDGMTITYKASSTVVNPTMTNAETFDTLKLDFTMQAGDIITINTYKGDRSITLNRLGVITNIFNSFDISVSKFLQLSPGYNILAYSADSGAENLEVSIGYKVRKVGV